MFSWHGSHDQAKASLGYRPVFVFILRYGLSFRRTRLKLSPASQSEFPVQLKRCFSVGNELLMQTRVSKAVTMSIQTRTLPKETAGSCGPAYTDKGLAHR